MSYQLERLELYIELAEAHELIERKNFFLKKARILIKEVLGDER